MTQNTEEYTLKTNSKSAMLTVEATPSNGSGFARLVITQGRLVINQSAEPKNPSIDLEQVKQLIEKYEAINAD